jgi:hypothetical protein
MSFDAIESRFVAEFDFGWRSEDFVLSRSNLKSLFPRICWQIIEIKILIVLSSQCLARNFYWASCQNIDSQGVMGSENQLIYRKILNLNNLNAKYCKQMIYSIIKTSKTNGLRSTCKATGPISMPGFMLRPLSLSGSELPLNCDYRTCL